VWTNPVTFSRHDQGAKVIKRQADEVKETVIF